MIHARVYKIAGVEVGKPLPSYTGLSCYPIVYLSDKGATLCADCINSGELDDNVVDCGIHWEGEAHNCDACEVEIESAYGAVEPSYESGTFKKQENVHNCW